MSQFLSPRRGCAAIVAVFLVAPAASGQSKEKSAWNSVVEASASTLFGATSQTLTSFASSVSHTGKGFTADASAKFRYGESEDAERTKFVSSRSWWGTMSADIYPDGRFSPFVLGTIESSLEKRIERRWSGGVGAKLTLANTNTGKASISLALLGERTVAMRDTVPAATLARWSVRAKFDQKVADRVSFTHTTFYAPSADAIGRYTVTSTSIGSVALNKIMSLTLTFTDNYDSQARMRGAPTNNDGSLLFGVRGAF